MCVPILVLKYYDAGSDKRRSGGGCWRRRGCQVYNAILLYNTAIYVSSYYNMCVLMLATQGLPAYYPLLLYMSWY